MKRKRARRTLGFLLVIAMLAAMMPTSAMAADNAVPVTVEWNDERQVMDGLGGAWAFNKAEPLVEFLDTRPEVTEEYLDLLFDDETGVGLDIVRVIVGDGGIINADTGAEWGNRWYDGPSDTIWPHEDSGYVWDMDDWAQVKPTFDRGQVWLMKEAAKRGVSTFYANAWTAPYWMKQNQDVRGGNYNGAPPELKKDVDPETGRLKYYEAYADYFVQYALGYKREFGITITHINPVNESESQHSSYSGIVLRGNDYKVFVEEYLGPAFKKAEADGLFAALGMDAPKIVGPETTNLTALGQYSSTTSNINPETGKHDYIDVFSTHIYGSAGTFQNGPATAGVTSNYPTYLNNYDSLWQTEYMTQDGANPGAGSVTQNHVRQLIGDGLYWTRLITNMFNSEPGFNAWLWWWPLGNNGVDGSDLMRLATSGSPQGNGDTTTGEVRVFKRFYTFGQFSRFVDPGYIHIDATNYPAENVSLTAFKAPAGDDFSIVVTNESTEDVTLEFDLQDFPAFSGVTGYRTSASENQIKLDNIAVAGGKFTATLPAQSVVTFVATGGAKSQLPGLDYRRDIWSTLEAENNDGANSGYYVEDGAIGGMADGDYLKYANVNFADGSANGGVRWMHILSLTANLAPYDGGSIEFRIDAPDGKLVGKMVVPAGDGEMTAYTTQLDTGDLGAYGVKDLYVVFRGEGQDMFAIDNFVFGDQYLAPPTVLTNGGFDTTSTAPWAAWGSATLARTGDQRYNGPTLGKSGRDNDAYSAKLSGRAAGSGLSQDITGLLADGGLYTVNGFFMPTDASATASISLVGLDAEDNVLFTKPLATRGELTPYRWNQLRADFTYEADDAAKLLLVLADDTAADLFVDEVTLCLAEDTYQPSYPQPKPAFPGATFETGVEGFGNRGNGRAQQSDAYAHEGDYSLRVYNRSATWHGTQRNIADYINAGDEYEFRAWVRLPEGAADTTVNMTVELPSGTANQYRGVASQALKADDGWVELVGKMSFEEAFSSIQLYFESASANAEFYVDDISIVNLTAQIPTAKLKLTGEKGLLMEGDTFAVEAAYSKTLPANVVAVTLNYDAEKFELTGFTPADGLTVLDQKGADGAVVITLANFAGYEVTGLGKAEFRLRDGAAAEKGAYPVQVSTEYVYQLPSGEKATNTADSSYEALVTSPSVANFDIIHLSNVIDYFGTRRGDERWADARFYDYNGNNQLDIHDISYVALNIKL